jgi:hypothetical protein
MLARMRAFKIRQNFLGFFVSDISSLLSVSKVLLERSLNTLICTHSLQSRQLLTIKQKTNGKSEQFIECIFSVTRIS